MASATPTQQEQARARLSFAKNSTAKPKPPVATPKILSQPQIVRSVPITADARQLLDDKRDAHLNGTAGNSVDRTGQWTDTAQESAAPSLDDKQDLPERPRSIALVKISAAEDSSTQLSSSDGSGKPPSIDGKSVASATTFALDEKESLRPDDSASLRAVEEEDVTSPPDSLVADSRQGSDNGARPVGNGIPSINGVPNLPSAPDEKLIEALQSPRDRLFVVKIEQDFIDSSKILGTESEYSLPNYYATPYCRIPPPLSQMIMRREDAKSGSNTNFNSQNASKTTSEADGSDGSNDGKDKAALTREEREARYREARQRIFGAESEEPPSTDTTESGEDKEKAKDMSRSSSASGKKKSKKQRNYDDDDFQARSRFNIYYPQQYAVPGYTAENVVYYDAMPSADAQAQYGWSGQQYPSQNGSAMYQPYGQMQSGYDLSADFQRGMSFQSPVKTSQVTPKMASTPMAPYQQSFQQTPHVPTNQGWPQMNQQPSYPLNQAPFTTSNSRPMSAPQQPQPYAYGQFPPIPYNGQPNRNQHPIPGSYNRPQFNPQSQAFIPGGRNMPFQMQPNMVQGPPQMNDYGGFPMQGQPSMANQMPRMSPSAGSTPSFGSPQSMHGNGSAAMNRIAPQSGEQASSRIPSGASSIAKYGTPSHLPPKPPAPHQPPAPKFDLSSLNGGRGTMAPASSTRLLNASRPRTTTASLSCIATVRFLLCILFLWLGRGQIGNRGDLAFKSTSVWVFGSS
ncbi:hypothetical protein EJ07DRAFT_169906 [Lizonia empirigonia]|nr:hypothetical protein EJ07DRAFT_169906 [Lizonia empirigonia]